jgi:murein DD-endopeptidase MepM/ murein hydrolase activator NlpD
VKAKGYYTVILVPDARSAFRRIRVSVPLVRTLMVVLGALTLALGGLLVHYVRLSGQVSELNALRRDNTALSVQTHQYADSLVRLQTRLARLQSTVTKLGLMSGLEQTLPDAALGGVGGATAVDNGPPSRDPDVTLHALSRSLTALTERSERIESYYADQTVLLSHTPSVWPVRGYLSSGFGNRIDPFTGAKDFHPGIDVSAPRGTKVVAPADGVVVTAGRRGGYGNAIVIDHGYGIITRYGHLEAFNVRPGQRVRRGDVIGFVGSTGRSNAPHLHYEVWVNDKTQNPIHYILEEYRSFG